MKNEKLLKSLLGHDVKDFDEEQLVKLLNEHMTIDVDDEMNRKATFGERAADKLAAMAGSWAFVLGFVGFLLLWVCLNAFILVTKPDPYPFILLNLILSCIAAIQAPIIMMSQNRQSAKDTRRSQNDFKTNVKSELMIELLYKKVAEIEGMQKKIIRKLESKEN